MSDTKVKEGEVIEKSVGVITEFDVFRSELAELKSKNDIIFDCEDPQGYADAKKHLKPYKKAITALEKARKQEKAYYLEGGRQVDKQAKEISAQLIEMVDVHEVKIKEIDAREKLKEELHQKNIVMFSSSRMLSEESGRSAVEERATALNAFDITSQPEEYQEQYLEEQTKTLNYLEFVLSKIEQAEDKIKEESAKRDAEIAARAKAEAERAAEEKAKQVKIEQDLAIETAKREKAEAESRAANAEKQAAENAKREQEQKELEEKQAAEKREANKKHNAKINNAAKNAFMQGGLSDIDAENAVKMIDKNQIPAVKISY